MNRHLRQRVSLQLDTSNIFFGDLHILSFFKTAQGILIDYPSCLLFSNYSRRHLNTIFLVFFGCVWGSSVQQLGLYFVGIWGGIYLFTPSRWGTCSFLFVDPTVFYQRADFGWLSLEGGRQPAKKGFPVTLRGLPSAGPSSPPRLNSKRRWTDFAHGQYSATSCFFLAHVAINAAMVPRRVPRSIHHQIEHRTLLWILF